MIKIVLILYKGKKATTAPPTETIPEWMKPYLQAAGNEGIAKYQEGAFGKVAGTNANLNAAFGSGTQAIADQTNLGLGSTNDQRDRLTTAAQSGGYDTTALKDAAILQAGQKTAALGNQYGGRGVLGSSRQAVEQGAQDASTAAQFATIDQQAAQQNFANKMTAEGALGQVNQAGQGMATAGTKAIGESGTAQRGIEQEQQDADWTAYQRFASSMYGNPARQQAGATTQGGK